MERPNVKESHTKPLRVAIATDDGITSNVRFGELTKLYIYEYDESLERFEYVQTRSAPNVHTSSKAITNIYDTEHEVFIRPANDHEVNTGCVTGGAGGCSGGNGKGCHDDEYMTELVNTLKDCSYLLVRKIGPRPSRILLREGISTLEKGGEIDESLLKLSSYVTKKKRAMTKRSVDPVSDDKEE